MALITGKILQEHLQVGTGAGTAPRPGGGTLNGTQIGIHSFAIGQAKTSTTWAPPTVAHGAIATTTVAVIGAALGDFVEVSFSLDLQFMTLSGYVSSANVVTVVLTNLTGAPKSLASGTVAVLVKKSK